MEEALGASRPRPRTCCSPKQEHTREQSSAIIEVNGSGRGDTEVDIWWGHLVPVGGADRD